MLLLTLLEFVAVIYNGGHILASNFPVKRYPLHLGVTVHLFIHRLPDNSDGEGL